MSDPVLELSVVVEGKVVSSNLPQFRAAVTAYVAAINRFRDVVERYQTTSQVPEALHRLVETYLMLGITAEAQKYASVLGHNYPDSAWYKRSFALLGKNAPQPEQIKDEKTFGLF